MRGVLFCLLGCAPMLCAQDPFKIHIYEYEPLTLNEYSLEAHLNFVTQGTPFRDGTLLPHQASDASHAGADLWVVGKLRPWIHVPERTGARIFSAVRRLAGAPARVCAGVVAVALPAGLCRGIFVSEDALRGELAARRVASDRRPRVFTMAGGLQSGVRA